MTPAPASGSIGSNRSSRLSNRTYFRSPSPARFCESRSRPFRVGEAVYTVALPASRDARHAGEGRIEVRAHSTGALTASDALSPGRIQASLFYSA